MTTSGKLKLAGIALGAALMTTAAVAGSSDAKCGAGKCGGDVKKVEKKADGKCGAGKCGGDKAEKSAKMMDKKMDGDKMVTKKADGKCGAGKCG